MCCSPVLREALGVLASDSKAAVVRLNPVDLEVVCRRLADGVPAWPCRCWRDAAMQPGWRVWWSLLVRWWTARCSSRWQRAVASLGLESDWKADHGGQRQRSTDWSVGQAAVPWSSDWPRFRRRTPTVQGADLEVRGTLTRLAGLVLEAGGHPGAGWLAVRGALGAARNRCWPRWWALPATAPS